MTPYKKGELAKDLAARAVGLGLSLGGAWLSLYGLYSLHGLRRALWHWPEAAVLATQSLAGLFLSLLVLFCIVVVFAALFSGWGGDTPEEPKED